MEEEKGMEELRKIADAYFNTSTDEVKNLAKNFFKSLDDDGNDKVSLPEFMEFMKVQGHPQMRNKGFFTKLDKDKNGTLDFMEVMTLYYIIKSGRPFCDACGEFITGMFFTCMKCFDSTTGPFCVCLECYCEENYIHKHKQFMDNYALLEVKRKSAVKEATEKAQAKSTPSNPLPSTSTSKSTSTSTQSKPSSSGTSNAMVLYGQNNNNWQKKFTAFVGAVADSLCSIM